MKKRRLQRNTENGNGDVLTPEEEALLHDLSGVSHVDKPLPPPLVLPGIPAADADTEPDAPGDGDEFPVGVHIIPPFSRCRAARSPRRARCAAA